MEVSGNTILVTGGASGIGLALARRFVERGNIVIICGRREDKLDEAKRQFDNVITRVADVAEPSDREDLVLWATSEFPALNVLVNNAGIQRKIDLTKDPDWAKTQSEIAINLEAPIHLAQLIYPHLAKQNQAAIINVTSGLSFMPLANVPVYCATKAALHSFTLSLRWQLKGSSVEVIEVIPPAVNTDLQAPGLHTFGVNVDEFADAVFKGLEEQQQEIAYGTAAYASQASRKEIDVIYERMNAGIY
jgi:uncharacterized oxidoreductase